jgi:precorrin-8X/cobalt-precorrin-8 methylmutase
MTSATRKVHPIEVESYEILRSRVDTGHLPPLTRAVVERVIHSSADLDYLTDLRCDEATLAAASRAITAGAPLIADAEMVAAGVTTRGLYCYVNDPRAVVEGRTRSAAGIRIAFDELGPGAVWVIGNAPTALFELLTLDAEPALVIGLPVGFVGAAQAKAALRESGLPSITNVSEKGGSAVAAAALNALLYALPDSPPATGQSRSRSTRKGRTS